MVRISSRQYNYIYNMVIQFLFIYNTIILHRSDFVSYTSEISNTITLCTSIYDNKIINLTRLYQMHTIIICAFVSRPTKMNINIIIFFIKVIKTIYASTNVLGTNPQPVGGSITKFKISQYPGTKLGGPFNLFPNFSQYRVPKQVVPFIIFQISVGTRLILDLYRMSLELYNATLINIKVRSCV